MFSHHPNRQDIGKGYRYARGWLTSQGDAYSLSYAMQLAVTSPIVFRTGVRLEENFESASWIALDFDEGLSLAEAKNTFCDRIHVLAPTKSHQKQKGQNPPCDRFRLWLKLSQTITTVLDYKETVRSLVKTYDADPACVGAAQMFWPSNAIASVAVEGYTTDVVVAKKASFAPQKGNYTGRIPPWVQEWLDGKFSLDQGQHAGRNFYAFKTACWLAKNGWAEKDIVNVVMASCLPISQEPRVWMEIRKTVRSAIARVAKEREGPYQIGRGIY